LTEKIRDSGRRRIHVMGKVPPTRSTPTFLILWSLGSLLLLGGCADTYLYTWSRAGSIEQLQWDWRACLYDANRSYTPLVAGHGPKLTLMKDCMEKKGYTKVGGVKGYNARSGVPTWDTATQTEIHF
jgi:hypothetical protein